MLAVLTHLNGHSLTTVIDTEDLMVVPGSKGDSVGPKADSNAAHGKNKTDHCIESLVNVLHGVVS